MKQILYISFFLFTCFLLNSCKMRYIVNSDTPYSIFLKGSKTGVINTANKQIIIPAKFGWIEKYHIKNDYASKDDLFYFATYPRENNSIYLRHFLYDSKGELIYTFGVGESIKSFFYHNKQLYLITKTEIFVDDEYNRVVNKEFDGNLLLINEKKIKILLTQCSINHLGKNMISFSSNNPFGYNELGYFELNSQKKIILNSDDFYDRIYVENKNEIWMKSYNKIKRESSEYYENVLDSTLNVIPNPVKNAVVAHQNYFLTENEKGKQVTDYNGQTSPFTYPYLTPVKKYITYDDIHPIYNVLLDKLFVFSTHKEGTYKGIINIDGEIILPEKFTDITIRHLYYNTSPTDEFKVFLEENKLTKFYYYTIMNYDKENECTLFNQEGLEIIKFKHGKNISCSPEFDLMEKNRLQIKFHCTDSLKIYDLKTKKQIHSETNRRY